MAKLKQVASVFFGRYLVVTNTVASGCLMGAGDVAAQMIEHGNLKLKDIDKKRTGRYFTFGLLLGPMNHAWYSFLDKILPHATKRMVVKKIALDQAIAGPLNIAAFFVGLGCLEGKSMKQNTDDVTSNFWNVYKMDLSIWPAAQLINFYWVPRQIRMLYVCTISFGWNTFLTYYRSQHIPLENTDKVDNKKYNKLPQSTGAERKTYVTKNQKREITLDDNKALVHRTKKIAEKIKL